MPGFFESQIPVNLFFQSLGAWLTPVMQLLTYLGQEDFFILLIVIIFWAYDRKTGLRIAILLLVSNGINSILKLAFHSPRPFWIDPRVKALANDPSFGLPSGHTQNAASTWGGLLLPLKRWWAIPAYLLVVTLVGISRLYLGVHFLIDVAGGLIFGLLTALLYLRFEDRIDAWITKRSLRQLLTLSVACSLVMIVIFYTVQVLLGSWVVPEVWKSNALLGSPGEPIDPLSMRNLIKSAGTIVGLLAGAAWMARRFPGYSIHGPFTQKAQRLMLGFAGVLVIYAGLGLMLPRDSSLISMILLYVRFALVGSWVSVWAPLLFIKTRLVTMQEVRTNTA